MENIRYEVWLQNPDKFVTQCTIVLIRRISGKYNSYRAWLRLVRYEFYSPDSFPYWDNCTLCK